MSCIILLFLSIFYILVFIKNVNKLLLNCFFKMYITSFLLIFLFNLLFFFNSIINYSFLFFYFISISSFNYFIFLIISFVAIVILISSLDYLSIIESIYFYFLLIFFIIIMLLFVISFNLLFMFIFWEFLGLISYLLINFWSSRSSHGIKAIVFNLIGDILFLINLSFIYSSLFSFNFISFYSFAFASFYGPLGIILLFSFHLTFFSKSAQLPFSSWLIYAMSAPTPVSSLLHSSTMVIAGIYLGFIIYSSLFSFSFFTYSLFFTVLFWFIVIFTLLYSILFILFSNDIKSIIAYSTLNQLSYLFISLLSLNFNSLLYHIIVHALFKSLLFLLAGSLIHISINFQSIYKLRSSSLLLKCLFICSLSILIISFSKDLILSYLIISINSFFISLMCILGILFSLLYSIKLIHYIFYTFSSNTIPIYSLYKVLTVVNVQINSVPFSSFLLICYSIISLIIDYLMFTFFNFSFGLISSFYSSIPIIPISLFLFVFLFIFVFPFNSIPYHFLPSSINSSFIHIRSFILFKSFGSIFISPFLVPFLPFYYLSVVYSTSFIYLIELFVSIRFTRFPIFLSFFLLLL